MTPNHVHLIVVPGEKSVLNRAIGEAHRRYTRYINFARSGGAYCGKAGMVETAWNYRWRNIHAHLSGKSNGIVKVEPLLDAKKARLKKKKDIGIVSPDIKQFAKKTAPKIPYP